MMNLLLRDDAGTHEIHDFVDHITYILEVVLVAQTAAQVPVALLEVDEELLDGVDGSAELEREDHTATTRAGG